VKADRAAIELADRLKVEIDSFSIIYELSEWLETALKNRTPKKEEEVVSGKAKILVYFSTQKNTHVLGGRLDEGTIKMGQGVRIIRRDIVVGKGKMTNLQHAKQNVDSVSDGEFGMQIESKTTLAPGDYIEGFDTVIT
jgi:translation initiation factor IF-2